MIGVIQGMGVLRRLGMGGLFEGRPLITLSIMNSHRASLLKNYNLKLNLPRSQYENALLSILPTCSIRAVL